MDRFIMIGTVVVFVENRLQSGFTYAELERAVGFSLPHIRATFAEHTGESLSRYVLGRRITNAAFEMTHSKQSILDIAIKYGFSNPDSFTRAFRRVTGVNPVDFRKGKRTVTRSKLCAGVVGVSLNPVGGKTYRDMTERMNSMEQKHESDGSVVLYGVPRVHYGAFGGCTPYPISLKAVANYMGISLDYEDAMTECGAAFRLTWDTTCWNEGNVDVMFAFDDPMAVYQNGIEALGYECKLLGRSSDGDETKAEFVSLIKESIDKGIPVIALGIIGPPEACVITGYRDEGKTLLGWNCFQDSPECAADVTFDESGYFVTSAWWENKDTLAVMTMGEKVGEPQPLKRIVERAITVLSGRQAGNYAKGIAAYGAWKKALLDEGSFGEGMAQSLLVQRLMCQGDAMDCLSDGRKNAYKYFHKLAEKEPEQPLFARIAEQFAASATCAHRMYETLGGWERGEKQMQALARRDVRETIGRLIDECKTADEKVLDLLRELAAAL